MKKILTMTVTIMMVVFFCTVLVVEGCFIHRTAFWMRHGFDFMEAAYWAEDDVTEDIVKMFGWDKPRENPIKEYPMVNANINWVLLNKP